MNERKRNLNSHIQTTTLERPLNPDMSAGFIFETLYKYVQRGLLADPEPLVSKSGIYLDGDKERHFSITYSMVVGRNRIDVSEVDESGEPVIKGTIIQVDEANTSPADSFWSDGNTAYLQKVAENIKPETKP